jgi:hypothetical protein
MLFFSSPWHHLTRIKVIWSNSKGLGNLGDLDK